MNTYVKWGDPWFWEKLKYALPHLPKLTRGNMREQIFEMTQPRIRLENDKRKLINQLGVPATPPTSKTPFADVEKTFIFPNVSPTMNRTNYSDNQNCVAMWINGELGFKMRIFFPLWICLENLKCRLIASKLSKTLWSTSRQTSSQNILLRYGNG